VGFETMTLLTKGAESTNEQPHIKPAQAHTCYDQRIIVDG